MLAIMSRKAAGLPDISRPTSKALGHAELLLHLGRLVSRTSTASVTPSLRASGQRYGLTFGDYGEARACVPRHGRRHDPMGPAP